MKREVLIGQLMQKNQDHPQGANMRIGHWQSENFNATYSYPYFGSPMPMSWMPSYAHVNPYPSWDKYDTRAHSPYYYKPSRQYYAAPEDQRSMSSHMFKTVSIRKNRSGAQEIRKG